MFRYVGLIWDSTAAMDSAAAGPICRALQAREEWRAELIRPGLLVFATGARPLANRAYPLVAERGVVLGKLFRRNDLDRHPLSELSLTGQDTDRILRTGGRALVEDFWGRYVAFFHDATGRSLVLRDPSGALPCFRLKHQGVSIIFSWLEDVLCIMPWLPLPTVNWSALAAHILFIKLGGHDTALDGVRRVLPGEAVTFGPAEESPALLWNAATLAREPLDLKQVQAAGQLRRTVRSVAQHWASCHERLLLRLSGGVDSSILLSCLDSNSSPALVTCLNYHSQGADSDERQYARLAATRAGRTLIERERDARVSLEQVLHVARTPAPSNYVGRLGAAGLDAELAAELGATAMFTGAGGDQLFFELRCSWPAADYLSLRGPDSGFPTAAMDAARLGKVSVWRAMREALWHRLREADPWQDAGTYLSLVRHEALPRAQERHPYVHPALLPGHGLPVGKLNQTLQLLHPLDYYDPYETDTAPELINPLLSQPLIELCLRLPSYVLTQGGRGRALARQAFAGDLPVEIATRRAKGGMGEHIRLVLQRNLDFARSVLLDGELVRRGILDRAKVEEALSGRPTTLTAHTLEIHVYIGIEAWLRRWQRQPGEGSVAVPPA
jgi:asparagine synthase (glutamine-hydrolysing)